MQKHEGNETKRKEILEELNQKYLSFQFDHQKPRKVQAKTKINVGGKQTLKNQLRGEDLGEVQLRAFLERHIYTDKSLTKLNTLKPEFVEKIDLNRFEVSQDFDLIYAIVTKCERIDHFDLFRIIKSNQRHQNMHHFLMQAFPKLNLKQ